ncbi:MAG TPA: MFS transporter [Rubrobacteraceae bacterium]|nr:MFS transporter [Rubrobacteraceae bacterium]
MLDARKISVNGETAGTRCAGSGFPYPVAGLARSRSGYGNTAASYADPGIGAVNVGMTLVAIRLVDRVGRKPLLIAGLFGRIASSSCSGSPLSSCPSRRAPRTRRPS